MPAPSKLFDALITVQGHVVAATKVSGFVDFRGDEHAPAEGDEMLVVVKDAGGRSLWVRGKLSAW